MCSFTGSLQGFLHLERRPRARCPTAAARKECTPELSPVLDHRAARGAAGWLPNYSCSRREHRLRRWSAALHRIALQQAAQALRDGRQPPAALVQLLPADEAT